MTISTNTRRGLCIVAIVTVFIIMLAGLMGVPAVRRYDNYLSGLWVGDPGFLRKSQLSDLQLFISPEEGGSRQGYLILTDLDGNFISNQAVEMRVKSSIWAALRSSFKTTADAFVLPNVALEFDDGGEPPMPISLKLSLSMIDGSLTLYDDEKVYAFMTKDMTASASAIEAYMA
jgi:hypothetical protein